MRISLAQEAAQVQLAVVNAERMSRDAEETGDKKMELYYNGVADGLRRAYSLFTKTEAEVSA